MPIKMPVNIVKTETNVIKAKANGKKLILQKINLQKPCKDWLKAEGNEPVILKTISRNGITRKRKVVKFILKPDKEKTNQRMCLSEHPFGTIKRAMGATYFLSKRNAKSGW